MTQINLRKYQAEIITVINMYSVIIQTKTVFNITINKTRIKLFNVLHRGLKHYCFYIWYQGTNEEGLTWKMISYTEWIDRDTMNCPKVSLLSKDRHRGLGGSPKFIFIGILLFLLLRNPWENLKSYDNPFWGKSKEGNRFLGKISVSVTLYI